MGFSKFICRCGLDSLSSHLGDLRKYRQHKFIWEHRYVITWHSFRLAATTNPCITSMAFNSSPLRKGQSRTIILTINPRWGPIPHNWSCVQRNYVGGFIVQWNYQNLPECVLLPLVSNTIIFNVINILWKHKTYVYFCHLWHSDGADSCMEDKNLFIVHGQYNGPLTRYVKLRVAHAPGMPGTFSPPPNSKENAS